MPRPIRTIQLSETDRAELERLTRSRTTAQRVVERCRIVLASATGQKSEQICASVGVSKPTVKTWLDRFETSGIPGLLQDLPRSGRPPEIAPEKIAEVVPESAFSDDLASGYVQRAKQAGAILPTAA